MMQGPKKVLVALTCGLLSLSVLGAGLGVRAYADDPAAKKEEKKAEPKKAEPGEEGPAKPTDKKEEPKKRQPGLFPDFDDLFKGLPQGGLDPAQMKAFKEQMEMARKEMERAMKALEDGRPGLFPALPNRGFGRAPAMGQPKLGARVDRPGATLADQLDLPKDQGVVLEDVLADSPASKAGLKQHDILLELGGKPVPSNPEEFVKFLGELKPNEAMDAVVLRKGKRETVKGLKLADVKVEKPGRLPGLLPGFPALPGLGQPGLGLKGTTIARSGDQFTTTHTDGDVKITLKGTASKGKAEVSEVKIEEKGKETTYEGVDKVPAEHKEKVRKLAELSAGGRPRVLPPNRL